MPKQKKAAKAAFPNGRIQHMVRRLPFLGVLALGLLACACRSYEPPKVATSGKWEDIYFHWPHGIDEATEKAGLKPLRSYGVADGDYEIRIWRGFSTEPLECVIIRKGGGQMTATHLRQRRDESGLVDVIKLRAPKSGWQSFISQLEALGLFDLPFTAEDECERAYIDGGSNVIELNRSGIYGTHRYPQDRKGCTKSAQMDHVAEIIGMEFDSREEKCEHTEWFACSAILRSRRLADEQPK